MSECFNGVGKSPDAVQAVGAIDMRTNFCSMIHCIREVFRWCPVECVPLNFSRIFRVELFALNFSPVELHIQRTSSECDTEAYFCEMPSVKSITSCPTTNKLSVLLHKSFAYTMYIIMC